VANGSKQLSGPPGRTSQGRDHDIGVQDTPHFADNIISQAILIKLEQTNNILLAVFSSLVYSYPIHS
jgi:hypothetical protein